MKKKLLLSIAVMAQFAVNAQTARVQVIHNCADLAADSVDVYLNGGSTPLLDNFAFRTATGFIDAPAGTPIILSVAPKGSTSAADAIYNDTLTLDDTKTYILVANGIVSPTGYTPGASTAPFRLSVYDMARETSTTAGNVNVLVVHGSTDAPTVDVKAGTTTLINDVAFGQFGSAGYLNLPEADYTLDVTNSAGSVIVKRYSAPLAALNLGDSAITVLASGFLDSTVNSNGRKFGLFAVLPEGGPFLALPELSIPSSVAFTNAASNKVSVYPNPTNNEITIDSKESIKYINVSDITGKTVSELYDIRSAKVDLSVFGNGMYIVKTVSNTGEVSVFSVMKN